ncbi:recombinase-like helix-turn-helix domain-containing protein [Haloechinothrix sp. LS1_15]|uniref:recombinase-like helix-turn-helix domain-containing protein n=1 Tax=Haloechinothrix sp. LS1_15 TaxID=2652248 RepID=UPI0029464A2B|nr:recombinase-like helix-turn-helix domain-containing protein [Haloechinothrix sp. LS1_15]MDV6012019.1 hypothetical protein [Haloechinothrix sp. LS1_15]
MAPHPHPVQSRTAPTSNYADALADELEAIYSSGTHDLPGVVAALNASGVRPPDGREWTEATFTAQLAELGAKEV